ncbi:ectopic P granules protein 5 homolog isoform X2 [Homarus americanus]|uniref:ectopic P granules protein 5 homolog isoform X2 n=1 Tax=Homarus americanus TaxID=6706 RepID=UPI001C48F987|nr:ectopic P granules protein 5 homolog isoform X2 [Homarus americanus]
MLGCWPLDHALTVLSTILNPVKAREDFLHHLKETALPSQVDEDKNLSEDKNDNVWVVVDSSGEDEEDPAQLWARFNENDVVQILNQVPFKEIFQHILLIKEEDGSLNYDVSCTSHQGFMKLFAFATHLLQLFRTGLATYSQVRYRGATKRICRLLRHTVEYITDHWQSFLSLHQYSLSHSTAMSQAVAHLESLQVVVNNIFEATFVNEGTREALSRNGRDLLATIAAKHPLSISYLLTATQVPLMHQSSCHF